MHTPSLLLVHLLSTVASARESFAPPLLNSTIAKMQQLTCEEVYGTGAQFCGGPDSTVCYNPTLGQSCCPDHGIYGKGTVHSPRPGYCCDEDSAACAQHSNFTVPAATATTACGCVGSATSPVTGSPCLETPAVSASPTEVVPVDVPATLETSTTTTEGLTRSAPTDQAGAGDETVTFSESMPTSCATESLAMPDPSPSSNNSAPPAVEGASAPGNEVTLYWSSIVWFMVGLWSAC